MKCTGLLNASSALPKHLRDALLAEAQRQNCTLHELLEGEITREQHTFPQQFFDLALDGMVVARGEHLLHVNRAMQVMLGYDEETLLSRTFLNFVHPEDLMSTQRVLDILVDGEAITYFENRWLRADGTYIWLSWHSAVAEDNLIYAVARDVTAQKQLEFELAERSHEIMTLLESIHDAFFALDPNWRFSYVNREAEKLLQRRAVDLIGHSVWQEFPEAVGSTFYQQYHAAVETDETATFTEYYPPLDRWFEVKAYPSHTGLSVFFRDVTERKAMEDRLRQFATQLEERVEQRTQELVAVNTQLQEAKQFLQGVLDVQQSAIAVLDENGTIIMVNAEWKRSTQNDQMPPLIVDGVGMEYLDICRQVTDDKHDVSVVKNGIQRVIANPATIFTHTFQMTTVNGEHWYQLQATGFYSDGKPNVVINHQDVTEQKRIEITIKKALENEKKLSELKTRFLSLASHEFRTPLAIIQTSTDLLTQYYEKLTSDRRRNHLEKIMGQVHHLTHLLDDISFVQQSQESGHGQRVGPLNMHNLLHTLVDEVVFAQNFGGEITVNGDDSELYLLLDKDLMRQILLNLISNAAKYSPNATPIAIEWHYHGEAVVVSVADSGIGIGDGDKQRLFETFHRGDNVGVTPGTGMGLSIVKYALDACNGSIRVRSELGKGSTFVVTIPTVVVEATHEPIESTQR